jgi:chromosomal replication initiator protein
MSAPTLQDATNYQNHYQQIWDFVKQDLKLKYGEAVLTNWINKIKLSEYSNGCMILAVPTAFMRDWILHNYFTLVKDLWKHYDANIIEVELIISGNINTDATTPATIRPALDDSNSETLFSSILDQRLTFDNFVVGTPNELAYTAARAVAESRGVMAESNPLFLYGGVGLGKTHLMHAIAWHIKQHNKSRKVIYMSAEKFMYQFVRALRNKDIMMFKDQFRSVDVLMIDDIQFICGKDSTQEEFFHTFNVLIDNNKQIVISCDRSPSDLDDIEDRIKSRLGWGLVADVHSTTYELMLGILHSKIEQMNLFIPADVIEFLAQKITSNVRELEGALNKVIAHSNLIGKQISVEGTQEILKDLLKSTLKSISIDEIQRKVAERYNLKTSDLSSERRMRNIARPRQIAMYLAKQLTAKSLVEIGKSFGKKDHTTVIHAIRKIEDLYKTDPILHDEIKGLQKLLQ